MFFFFVSLSKRQLGNKYNFTTRFNRNTNVLLQQRILVALRNIYQVPIKTILVTNVEIEKKIFYVLKSFFFPPPPRRRARYFPKIAFRLHIVPCIQSFQYYQSRAIENPSAFISTIRSIIILATAVRRDLLNDDDDDGN